MDEMIDRLDLILNDGEQRYTREELKILAESLRRMSEY